MSFSKNNLFNFLYQRQALPLLVGILIALIISALIGALIPRTISSLFESYQAQDEFTYYLLLFLGLSIGQYFNYALYQVAIKKYIVVLIKNVRKKVYSTWLRARPHLTGRGKQDFPMGEVLARTMNDTEAIRELVTSGAIEIVIDLFFILSCFIGFFTIHLSSGLILIFAEVVICILLYFGSLKMAKIYTGVRKGQAHLSRVVANISGGVDQTYYTPNASYASKKAKSSFQNFLHKILSWVFVDSSYYSLAESLFPLLLLLLVFVLPLTQVFQIAILGVLIDLIQRSITPIKDIAGGISNIQRCLTGTERVQEFLDELGEPFSETSDFILSEIESIDIAINHFSYPALEDRDDSFSVDNIHLKISNGTKLGIVGPSGGGKSTFFKLVAGELIPTDGEITLNFVDGRSLSVGSKSLEGYQEYKSYLSLVSQESHIFSESLEFNMTMGEGDEGFSQHYNELKEKIPYLKDWGVTPSDRLNPKELSFGQRQLISALRACYLKRPIVLFDEISSGLDSNLEQALRDLVQLIQAQALTFTIAHRLETITDSDQILVLSEGKLVGKGDHKGLIKTNPEYQELIKHLKHDIDFTSH